MEEILDLVNKKDEIIGEIKKSIANQNPRLIHREIAVMITNTEKQILMQQRSFDKKVYPGAWDIVCGHVGKGEDPRKAAKRELEEEVGLKLELQYIDKKLFNLPNETYFCYLFSGSLQDKNSTLVLDPKEVQKVEWLGKKEARKRYFETGDDLWLKSAWTFYKKAVTKKNELEN